MRSAPEHALCMDDGSCIIVSKEGLQDPANQKFRNGRNAIEEAENETVSCSSAVAVDKLKSFVCTQEAGAEHDLVRG